jgi:uncharacterized protein (TIGR00251 family)
LIKVDVKPDSKVENVEKINEETYIVRIKAPKRKGKANAAVIKLLRKYFGCPVRIISGHSSNRKIIEIDDKDN